MQSDEQLVTAYRNGESDALEFLIQRYLKSIYHFAYRMVGTVHDAEDVTQEAFVKAWKNIHKFDPRKSLAPYRTEGSGSGFKAWIFSIAKNTALDFLKKKKAVPFSSFGNEEGDNALIERIADAEALPSEVFDRADLASFLASALAKLPPMYRVVLTLRYNEQLNFREIAEVLSESIHTVKSRHRRAILLLRELLVAPKDVV
ncbi:MAG: sigma-70 family RNA polymerase sigma factor [bacterium]|nr:sigma-70 family RNA polymerase sigma factor [bacterium]